MAGEEASPHVSTKTAVKDEQFYRLTGDTVFRVEDTLFKVHRLYLTEREESSFGHMFALPQPPESTTSVPDGTDDEHPIILHDTAEEFHVLCWALYALPPELQESAIGMPVSKLASLVSITHKYCFSVLKDWSLSLCRSRCFADNSTYLTSCPQEMLERLLSLSIRLHDADFQKRIEDQWIGRLKLETVSMAYTLDAGERLSLRGFLGRAYYVALLAITRSSSSGPANGEWSAIPRLLFPSDLSELHISRLKEGLCSLVLLSDRICRFDNIDKSQSPEYRMLTCAATDLSERMDILVDKRTDFQKISWSNTPIVENIRSRFSENLPTYFLGSSS